jgi:hypothetical protein
MRLLAGGSLVLEGWLRLLAWTAQALEVQLLGGNAAWGLLFKNRPLADVDTQHPPTHWRQRRWWHTFDACHYAHTLTHTGWVSPHYAGGGTPHDDSQAFQCVAYPLVAYNHDALEHLPGAPLPLHHLRPAAFVAPLLHAHFEAAGFRLESEWLRQMSSPNPPPGATPPLVLPFVGDAWAVAHSVDETALRLRARSTAPGATSNRLLVLATNLTTLDADTLGEWGTLPMADPEPAPNGYGTVNASAWRPTQPGVYRVQGLATRNSPTPNPVFFAQVLDAVGTMVHLAYTAPILDALGGQLTFSFDLHFRAEWVAQGLWLAFGQVGALNASSLGAESYVEVRRLNQAVEGAAYDVRAALPPLTVMELLNALAAMFHLHFHTHPDTRIVRMEPRDAFLRPGGLNLDNLLDTRQPLRQSLAAAEAAATHEWAYATDRADVATADQAPYPAAEAWHNPLAHNPESRSTLSAAPLAPTAMAWNDEAGILYPSLRNADYPTYRTRHAPRILAYRAGQAAQPFTLSYAAPCPTCPGGALTSGSLVQAHYPQAWFHTLGGTLGFGPTPTAHGLAALHYGTLWHNLARARLLQVPLLPQGHPPGALADFSRLHRLGQQRVQALQLQGYAPAGSAPTTLLATTQDARHWAPPPRFSRQRWLAFVGPEGRAATPDAPAHWAQPAGIAVALWLWVQALPTHPTGAYIAGHEAATGTSGWRLVLMPNGSLALQAHHAGGTSLATSAVPLPTGQWVHVVAHLAQFRASHFALWVDGAPASLAVAQNDDCAALAPAAPFCLGQPAAALGPQRLQGRMAHVALARAAAPAWVAAVWAGGSGALPPNPNGLLALWPLAETHGNQANPLWGPRPLLLTGFPAAHTAQGGIAWGGPL